MYAAAGGNQVDHELYLLGKPVDKAVDPMAQENEEVKFLSSLFLSQRLLSVKIKISCGLVWMS